MIVTGPLFKWFGSKWSAAKHYPNPIYDSIIEPFAGSAGYSLNHNSKTVILCESDTHIFDLWSWLIQDAKETDILEIPIKIPVGTDIRTLGLTKGQELLLKNWQRTNNVGNCWTISPWGNKPGQWTNNCRRRIAYEFHAVKHWKIYKNAFGAFQDFVEKDCTWFIDPPYQFNYKYKSNPIDYNVLAECITKLKGHSIVCEAVDPKNGNMPSWLPFMSFRSSVTSRRKNTQSHHSKEVMWESYGR